MSRISKTEAKRRERTNRKMFPGGLIDIHNDKNKPCECCGKDSTRGNCFEDKDGTFLCNYCYWTVPIN